MYHWGVFVQPFLQWKTISITHCECVSVDLVIQHAMRMHHIVICGLIGSTIFFHSISKNDMIWQGVGVSEHKMCNLIFCTTFIWNISHSKKKWASYYHKCTYIGLHVKYHHSCQILMELESSWKIFKKYSNIKFHENPSSGSPVVACRQMDRQTNTRKKKIILAFHNFTNTPKHLASHECSQHLFLHFGSNAVFSDTI